MVRKFCALGFLFFALSSRASNELPFFGPHDLFSSDLQTRFHCLFLVSNMVARHVKVDTGLLSPEGVKSFEQMRASVDENHDYYFRIGIVQMADILHALGRDQFDEVMLWDDQAFGKFLRIASRNENEALAFEYGRHFFRQFGPGVIEWKGGSFDTGSDSELLRLLSNKGNSASVMGLVAMKNTVMAFSERTPTILGETSRALKKFDKRLTVCVLNKNCSINIENAAAFYIDYTRNHDLLGMFPRKDDEVFPRNEGQLFSVNPHGIITIEKRDLPIGGITRDMAALVVPYPKKIDTHRERVEWLKSYFHEATHSVDMIRLSQWVRANLILRNRGLEIDPYFSSAFRVRSRGNGSLTFESFYPFFNAYLETGARESECEVERLLRWPAADDIESRCRLIAASSYLQIAGESGPEFLERHWKVTRKNFEDVFSIGRDIRRSMDFTIKRAKEISPPGTFVEW